MANQGAKKRKEQNHRHMINLLRLVIFCNVVYILVRMVILHSTTTWKHWVGLFVTSLAYTIPYQQLAKMASPSYSDDGELLDGGFDMSTGGVCGLTGYTITGVCFHSCCTYYLHDVIYITSFVQLMSIFCGKFWCTYLVIPALAIYKGFGFLKGFLFQSSEGNTEDEKSRKKREKMEKKASRPKFVKTRNR